MRAHQSIEYTDSSMNAKKGIPFSSGKPSPIVSTAFQSLPWLTKKYCACMEVSVRNLVIWARLKILWDLLMFQILVKSYFLTFWNKLIKLGLLCDLLWSDPDKSTQTWAENERGVSYIFGVQALNSFLRKNDLDLICRAHQVVEDGYEFFNKRQLVTLFSAPNYCGEFNNAGALMTIDENLTCSFQILQPNDKKINQFGIGRRPNTPPRGHFTGYN